MVYIPIDDQILKSVRQILARTDMEVIDEQAIFDNGMLERCPLCDCWTWTSPTYWNQAKGCCTCCGEQDD